MEAKAVGLAYERPNAYLNLYLCSEPCAAGKKLTIRILVVRCDHSRDMYNRSVSYVNGGYRYIAILHIYR